MNSLKRRLLMIAVVIGMVPLAVSAQNIAEIAKSDPLLISGAIGTQNTYYYSSQGNGYATPLSNSFYANLNISVYGINMPFSFMYNNNQTSFSYPTFSFNISPSYKNWTLHIGRRTMPFSNYIYNLPFDGAGIEYSGKKFRFGAFYGLLRKAINDDPMDPSARSPQYSRKGMGFKVGYGNRLNYLDLYIFRAKDNISSIDARWYEKIAPQENLALGMKGRLSFKQYLSLTANMATSIFSTDMNSERLKVEALNNWDKIFEARYSSLYRFAGDVSLNFNTKAITGMVSYKMIQPDYQTLGSNYISNNVQSLGINLSTNMFHNKLSLTGTFSGQEDNLSGKQLYTNRGLVYSASSNLNLIDNLMMTLSYNGYRQIQNNGTAVVNDTTRVNRIMHSLTASPSYTFSGSKTSHYVGVSYSYNMNKDLNTFNHGVGDVTTHAGGVNYSLTFNETGLTYSGNYCHQTSKGDDSNFTTDVVSLGVSRSMLENKNLNLSADASAGINSYGEMKSVSYGLAAAAAYTLKEAHQFTFHASVNKFNDYYVTSNTSYNGFDLTLSLNYSYTFSLLELRRSAEKEDKPKARAKK